MNDNKERNMVEDTEYLDHLKGIAKDDAEGLIKAQASYGNSWKSRGGVGAFMMLARKWDRLENRVKRSLASLNRDPKTGAPSRPAVSPYDIFAHVHADTRGEGLIDDIRDLRRYLLLVEAELMAQGAVAAAALHRDNKEE